MPFTEINGAKFHYLDEGDRDSAAIVFSNSLGTDVRLWDKVRGLLPRDARVIRYDKRGHGLSEATAPPYSGADLAADAAALLDFLGVRSSMFVGLSIGGQTAMHLAVDRPDLVRSVALSNTAAKLGDEKMWQLRIDAASANGIDSIADGVLERWFSEGFRESNPDEIREWRAILTGTSVPGYIGCCEALKATDLRSKLGFIGQPTLVIAGSEDGAATPSVVRDTAERITGAEFLMFDGAGHLPPVEQPDAYASAICAFFAKHMTI